MHFSARIHRQGAVNIPRPSPLLLCPAGESQMSDDWVLTRDQVRQIDQWAVERGGIPSLVLMENAGRGCTDVLAARLAAREGPVCVCCGKGNNGGDGFVIARHLAVRDIPVHVCYFHEPDAMSHDARVNFIILKQLGIPTRSFADPAKRRDLEGVLHASQWIVDALLGTGITGSVREEDAQIIEALNRSGRPILAVDLPSGMDCDTGAADSAISATVTATMVALKPALVSPQGLQKAGEVVVVDIGIPPDVARGWVAD